MLVCLRSFRDRAWSNCSVSLLQFQESVLEGEQVFPREVSPAKHPNGMFARVQTEAQGNTSALPRAALHAQKCQTQHVRPAS